MIEKLVKEFEKIRTSLAKSKKLIVADIDKIDEKYRKLAQEEKKSLTENLAILNEQLKYYDRMLDGETVVEEPSDDSEEEPQKNEEEPAIFDTIYPENNKEDEAQSVAESAELAQVAAVADAVSDNSVLTAAEVGTDVALESPAEETEKVKGLAMDEIVQKLEDAGIVDVETVAPQDNDWVTEPKEVPVLEMSDTGWAEFPEDWK